MNRREFLMASAGACMVALESGAAVKRREAPLNPLRLKRIKLEVGAEKPFSAVQVSDTHIARASGHDDERKQKLAAGRSFAMWGEHYLDEAIAEAKSRGAMMLHTGDMIDFVSEANLDMAAAHFMEGDWFVSAGNHEYSKYVGEAKEDEAYKHDSYDKVQAAFPNDLTFASRVVNGVNLVAIDDVYYYVSERAREQMEAEVKKGLPIVLMCHVPFYTPELAKSVLEETGGRAAYVTGAPLEMTEKFEGGKVYPEGQEWRARRVQQFSNKMTLDFIAWLKEQKLLKAVLTGHLHRFFEERFSPTAMQYVCSATYRGEAALFDFV